MAKQALSEALSLDKPNSLTDSKDFNLSNNPSQSQSQSQTSSTYASSAENISRLLQNWMKNPPKSSGGGTNSAETMTDQNSFNNVTTTTTAGSSSSDEGATTAEGFDSFFSFNSCNSSDASVDEQNGNLSSATPENSVFQDESKPNLETVPLTLIEKWLLDDASGQAHEDLINMSLEDSAAALF
ncbi:myb-related protein [Corchorus olitorius]|uniref:Myb-related protein n=1 Tax=Corchorus olitorius TaxID=93759 RepID=A0A1R3HM01_9ROSI|nr:myb-related protein [Corchorus olitorius]